jgi:hypothetical protein
MISSDLMDPPIRLVLITSLYLIGILIRYIGWSDIKPPMNYGCTRNKEIRGLIRTQSRTCITPGV